MRYTLSRDKVRPGALTVQLNDRGEDPHAMAMEKLDSEGKPDGTVIVEMTTEPGGQETKTIDLEPGRYRCAARSATTPNTAWKPRSKSNSAALSPGVWGG